MASSLRSLLTGLFAGLFLALVLQQTLPSHFLTELPSAQVEKGSHGSTRAIPEPFPFADTMLRNTLQIARQAARIARGYKSARPAASLLQTSATSSPTPPHHHQASPFSTTTAAMASKKSVLDAIRDRRTFYALNKEAPISDKEIVSLVKEAVLHVPSSFNSQSARLVVLLNAEHDKFWDATLEILKAIVPEDQFASTKGRIDGFKGAYGSILFFEDPEPVHALEKQFPIYAHHFPTWSEHTSAMHQYALWVALEAEGFGANLQHYNPIVDQRVQTEWNVPKEWTLRAQLVFGGKIGDVKLPPKEFKDVEGTRLFVHGAKE